MRSVRHRLRSRSPRLAQLVVLSLPVEFVGCGTPILNPQGHVGEAEKTSSSTQSPIMLVLVVPTMLATLAVAWFFRASNCRSHSEICCSEVECPSY